MKKIRLFKIPFSFDELDAEFNFLNADNDYCGMLLKLLKKYTDFFNLGLAGIPYKERYEILNARTRKEKAIADTIYENNFYEVEGNDIFLADFLVENNIENDAENDTKNAQKSAKKCVKNDAKIVKKNVKKIVKNDYIFSILFSIKNRSKLNQKNGKKGGYHKHKNALKATAQAKNDFSADEKNRVATATPFATDFATQKTPILSSETSRQNSKNSKNNINNNNINPNITTDNNSNIEAVVVLQNHEKNQQISQNEIHKNSVVDVVEKNQTQNENEKIQNLPIQKNEAQITFDFFVKMLPQFRYHMPNEVFNETFTKGATLQDYRNAYSGLSEDQKKTIKSINYLASIVSTKQNEEPKTNIIPISNSSQVSQVSVEAQLQLALTKRLNMIYFKLNKKREALEKQACNYFLKTGERMPDDLRKQFLLEDFTASEIELIKKENVRILPEKEVKDISNNNENLLFYSGEIAF